MLIDPHVHSNEISRCSHVSIETLIDTKIALGYGGAVLTNHCQQWYYDEKDHRENMQKHIDVFHQGKEYADKKGFLLMLGIEVTITDPGYSDWLLYGVDEEFLLSSPCLYKFSQRELYEYCRNRGVLMIQAHPYRGETHRPMDPEFMDGVEINCQPGDLPKKDQVIDFAVSNNLLLTCGVDFHGVSTTIRAGMEVPNDMLTSADFAAYLKSGKGVMDIEGNVMTYEQIRKSL